MYHNQIVHHKPCFNLFVLHNNLFDNQGREIKYTVVYENFVPTLLYSLSLYMCIHYIYIIHKWS